MDKIISILESLRDSVVDRDSQKSSDMSTALLLEVIGLFGIDAPVMAKTFPFLERIKDDVQQQKFDDALPTVFALLAKFRQTREQYAELGSKDPHVAPSASGVGDAPNEENHVTRETGRPILERHH